MVLNKIIQGGVALSKLDKKGWDKLYFGIRADIKLGIKHGFGAGSIIGDLLNDRTDPFVEDGIPEKPRYGSKTYKFSKKYSRRRVSRCRCRNNNRYDSRSNR